MPTYLDINGAPVSAHIATINGKLRFGYRETIGEGEHVSFDLMNFDSATTKFAASDNSVFMMDKISDSSIVAELHNHMIMLADGTGMGAFEYFMTWQSDRTEEVVRKVAVKLAKSQVGDAAAIRMINGGNFDSFASRVHDVFARDFHQRNGISQDWRDSPPNF